MSRSYVIKAKKIVTVTSRGTIYDGAIIVENGKLKRICTWQEAQVCMEDLEVVDYSDRVITPSLIDCHTHLMEFAPLAKFPITIETHGMAARALLLEALASGVTGLGEQICGFYKYDLDPSILRYWTNNLPMDIRISSSTVSLGFAELAHYSAATGSTPIAQEKLTDPEIVSFLADNSDYPGENLFINATPANFTADVVPLAGEIMYTQEQLDDIVHIFHEKGKKIGAHVGGEQAIQMALNAGIDVLHHAHGITSDQINQATSQMTSIVATPIGGTHLLPNSPQEIASLVRANLIVAISTDGLLPAHEGADWIPSTYTGYLGPETLMMIARPAMKLLQEAGFDENEILALITRNPAIIMGKENQYGSLQEGLDANFLVTSGVPGIEVIQPEQLQCVYYKGKKVIERE